MKFNSCTSLSKIFVSFCLILQIHDVFVLCQKVPQSNYIHILIRNLTNCLNLILIYCSILDIQQCITEYYKKYAIY